MFVRMSALAPLVRGVLGLAAVLCASVASAQILHVPVSSDTYVDAGEPGTSFDAFRDYEERGRVFKELVGRLPAPGRPR